MEDNKKIFHEEYETDTDTISGSDNLAPKEEEELIVEQEKYGVGKPIRKKIRARMISRES